MMPKNPRIEVFRIILNPSNEKRKKFYSFREFYIKKYGLNPKTTNNTIFNTFYAKMFNVKDSSYNEDKKRRKAFRISKNYSKDNLEFVINGVIEGGSYDVGKTTGDRKTKSSSVKLGENIIVQDDFYFLIQTKLNEKEGILILQSYGSDKIDDVFLPFLKKLFKESGQTFEATIKPLFPNSIVELAKNTAIVSELNYQTNNLVVNQISEDGNDVLAGKFNVKIIITPLKDSIPINQLSKWKRLINKAIFKFPEKEMNLESFNSKTGYLKSTSIKNPTRFEINAEDIKIHPSIYLDKIDSVIIEENGVPDWDSLQKYCEKELLPELQIEVYGKD